MATHKTGTPKEWLAARLELHKAEMELTRHREELARLREALPLVPVDKAYRFETDEGSASLADLFKGRSQLLVYHFMFGPDYKAGCPSCSYCVTQASASSSVLTKPGWSFLRIDSTRPMRQGGRVKHLIEHPGFSTGKR
jgi:predicted dithiol-disulfide oxidoreductase (DUF899 family)